MSGNPLDPEALAAREKYLKSDLGKFEAAVTAWALEKFGGDDTPQVRERVADAWREVERARRTVQQRIDQLQHDLRAVRAERNDARAELAKYRETPAPWPAAVDG